MAVSKCNSPLFPQQQDNTVADCNAFFSIITKTSHSHSATESPLLQHACVICKSVHHSLPDKQASPTNPATAAKAQPARVALQQRVWQQYKVPHSPRERPSATQTGTQVTEGPRQHKDATRTAKQDWHLETNYKHALGTGALKNTGTGVTAGCDFHILGGRGIY